MRTLRAIIPLALVLPLAACGGDDKPKAPISTTTSTAPAENVPTFGAPTWKGGPTQSSNAATQMPSPTDSGSTTAPPPTVVITPSATATTSAAPSSETTSSTVPSSTSASSAKPTTPSASSSNVNNETLAISTIGLSHRLTTLSASGGSLTPAKNTISWYDGSAAPGTNGTAVILGHKSDLFAKMSQIKTGDRIVIGGTTYAVSAVKANQSLSAVQHDADLWKSSNTKRVGIVVLDGSNPATTIIGQAS